MDFSKELEPASPSPAAVASRPPRHPRRACPAARRSAAFGIIVRQLAGAAWPILAALSGLGDLRPQAAELAQSKAESAAPAIVHEEAGPALEADPAALKELCRQLGLELQRLRAENQRLKAELEQLAAETEERLAESTLLTETNRYLQAENRVLKQGLLKLMKSADLTRARPMPAPQPAAAAVAPSTPGQRPGPAPAAGETPLAGANSPPDSSPAPPTASPAPTVPPPPPLPAAAAAPGPAPPPRVDAKPPSSAPAELTHWLTTATAKRHNRRCPFYRNSAGRPCNSTEGKPCKTCGG